MQIGPYKLLEQIGEGGFGVVFMAEQLQPVRRRVALKVIKPGMDTQQVIARFEQERQALALMDHPNIAKVLDAGTTTSGRPYFVMELIRGVTITQYCDEHRLAPKERLDLFVAVCQAVQHAHQKGIIHRDIKPTNVLVTLHDGQPLVKVIDFGVAKATGQQLTERTLFTNFAQMIGTPLYMSPEQAELTSQDIDTRTDIYSLGVLLYELLTGTTPFEKQRFHQATFDEIRRIIREEEPPRPSLRLSSLGDTLPSISTLRHMEPRALRKLVRGDLDWIVMQALEKDRNRRYETANSLAMDVRRYLADEPVLACPPTWRYRLRKLFHRYRSAAAVMAVLIVSLVMGVVGTTWGMIRARSTAGNLKVVVEKLERTSHELKRALNQSEQERFDSLLNEARAWRSSRGVGQRSKALAAAREAAKIRVTPALRDAAAAALVLPDLDIVTEWEGHPAGTNYMAWDAAFQTFTRIEAEKGITVFKLVNEQEEIIATLPTNPPYSGEIVMSPDGRFLAVPNVGVNLAASRGVVIWDLTQPQSPLNLADQPVQVYWFALAFHPNSRQVAIGHPDGTLSVYDLPSGRKLHHLHVARPASRVSFHPKANRLAVACDRIVQLFDLDIGAELSTLEQSKDAVAINNFAWHPDGRRLATGCDDFRIHWWDTETATELLPAWDIGERGIDLAFNHAGDRLVSTSWSQATWLWDVATGRPILKLPGNFGLQFSPDDQVLGVGKSNTRMRISRVAGGQELRMLALPTDEQADGVWAPVVHQDGRLVMTTSHEMLRIWDLTSGELLDQMPTSIVGGMIPFSYIPRQGWLTAGRRGVLLWPVRHAEDGPNELIVGPPNDLIHRFRSTQYGASVVGHLLALPTDHDSTWLFNLHGPEAEPLELGPQFDARFCAISGDGQWVATGSHFLHSKSVLIWNAKTGKKVAELPIQGSTKVRFSPNGRWLSTTSEASCDLWETGSWRRVHHFDHHAQTAFSPDSTLMARGDVFGAIRLIDTRTFTEIGRLTAPEPGWLDSPCFTPDGSRLLVECDRRVLVFDLIAIRKGMAKLGFDWNWPALAPAARSSFTPEPVRVRFVISNQDSPLGGDASPMDSPAKP